MHNFLAPSQYIDWKTSSVLEKAQALGEGINDPAMITQACFEFVRDEIKHSWDYKINPVTCKASDVLAHGTGYCYAKSHLLAALLRANNLPAGLCYQRLMNTETPPFCLHGLTAVYLEHVGWYRLDPRGNKDSINAQFCPPLEQLAYSTTHRGEADLPEVWAEPLAIVVQALENNTTYQAVADNLPDLERMG